MRPEHRSNGMLPQNSVRVGGSERIITYGSFFVNSFLKAFTGKTELVFSRLGGVAFIPAGTVPNGQVVEKKASMRPSIVAWLTEFLI
jgi:hypothetical protein